ncbi:Apc15p protein-domain-containing protein [Pyrenochaeta sp. MPI-SDFR-AT-0127]|nr:Apc15p protein-domain-containing protein [Pyrenochaeta sp. MPI-SDFR-AT-0127]
MLSLPMIAPRPDASLWPSHRANHSYIDHESSQSSPPNAHNHRRPTSHHGPRHTSALLAALTNDENTIEQRKQNVRRFGAGWLRPPGVAKTLQAMKDEELEKEEQEIMQRREQVMMDLAAAQQDAANEEQREQGEQMEGQEEEERDLDDEVPEAEASDSDASPSDSSDESGSEDGQNATVPFNEDSFIEGSMLEAEVSHMLEMEEAEMAGVLQDERDLDDDVPEAGSYEHTDSELEDSSDIDNSALPHMSSVRSRRSARRSSGRRTSGRRSSGLPSGMMPVQAGSGASRVSLGADLGQGRSSFGMDASSSILDGSSFLRSSPAGAAAAARGSLRDRFLGVARGGRRA